MGHPTLYRHPSNRGRWLLAGDAVKYTPERLKEMAETVLAAIDAQDHRGIEFVAIVSALTGKPADEVVRLTQRIANGEPV